MENGAQQAATPGVRARERGGAGCAERLASEGKPLAHFRLGGPAKIGFSLLVRRRSGGHTQPLGERRRQLSVPGSAQRSTFDSCEGRTPTRAQTRGSGGRIAGLVVGGALHAPYRSPPFAVERISIRWNGMNSVLRRRAGERLPQVGQAGPAELASRVLRANTGRRSCRGGGRTRSESRELSESSPRRPRGSAAAPVGRRGA